MFHYFFKVFFFQMFKRLNVNEPMVTAAGSTDIWSGAGMCAYRLTVHLGPICNELLSYTGQGKWKATDF